MIKTGPKKRNFFGRVGDGGRTFSPQSILSCCTFPLVPPHWELLIFDSAVQRFLQFAACLLFL